MWLTASVLAVAAAILVWIAVKGASARGPAQTATAAPAAKESERTGGESAKSGQEAVAKIAIDSLEHDFGSIDPTEECSYSFVIRNVGQAPLQLVKGGTSCKCTVSDMPDQPVLPGKSVAVRVSSKIQQKEGFFSHSAKIISNDPQKQQFDLTISGVIRTSLGCSPERVVLSDPAPAGQAPQVLVYSQLWDRFAIRNVESSMKNLKWRVAGADRDALRGLKALSGYSLSLDLPPLPKGKVTEWLQVTVQPPDKSSAPRTATVDLFAKDIQRITVEGPDLQFGDTVRIGPLRKGEGAQSRLIMKVADEHRRLRIKNIETVPPYLHVSVEPLNINKPDAGLYTILIEVPKDAPAGGYMGPDYAKMRIVTDHPSVPELKFDVLFAVSAE
jgi:hypothetical protein